MGAPYSQDFRDRVLRAYDRGMKTKQIAEVFAVSKAWARRVKQRRHEHGETTPRKMGGPGVIKVDRARLADLVAEHPDATASELRELIESAGAELAFLKPRRRTSELILSRIRCGMGRTLYAGAHAGCRDEASEEIPSS